MTQPKLKAGVIYGGDNGQLICLHCAGYSAKYSGRDLSGHPITACTDDDAREWKKMSGRDLACERGCTVHKVNEPVTVATLREATLEARKRLADESVGTQVKKGRFQVVRGTFDKRKSTVQPLSEWLTMPDAVNFLFHL